MHTKTDVICGTALVLWLGCLIGSRLGEKPPKPPIQVGEPIKHRLAGWTGLLLSVTPSGNWEVLYKMPNGTLQRSITESQQWERD